MTTATVTELSVSDAQKAFWALESSTRDATWQSSAGATIPDDEQVAGFMSDHYAALLVVDTDPIGVGLVHRQTGCVKWVVMLPERYLDTCDAICRYVGEQWQVRPWAWLGVVDGKRSDALATATDRYRVVRPTKDGEASRVVYIGPEVAKLPDIDFANPGGPRPAAAAPEPLT